MNALYAVLALPALAFAIIFGLHLWTIVPKLTKHDFGVFAAYACGILTAVVTNRFVVMRLFQ